MIGRLIVVVLVVGLAQGAAAQSIKTPRVSVGSPPFTERLNQDILSSGGLIVGVMSGDLRRPVLGDVITVAGIRPADAFICISLKSVDGAYTAGFSVKNPQLGTTVQFSIPTKLVARLAAKTGELAILAVAGGEGGCDSKSPVLAAVWGAMAVVPTGYALVNDHQADLTSARVGNTVGQACQPIGAFIGSNKAQRSYQVACPINLGGGCAADAQLVIQFVDSGTDSDIRRALRRLC